MKSKYALFFLLLLSAVNYSQIGNSQITYEKNDKLVYLDSSRFETSASKHQFYKIIKDYKLDKSFYTIYEFNKADVLQMESKVSNKNGSSKEGAVTYFYENGNKKATTFYEKGRLNGKDEQWYENGTKKLDGEYIANKEKRTAQHKINQFWDINGVQKVIDGNGFFEDEDGNEYSKGEIKNGFKEGDWEGSFKKPDYSYKETYKGGELVYGESTDKNGKTYPYKEVEIAPKPRYGMMDFYKFIGANYQLPKVGGLIGKVYIAFIVDKTGEIVEPRVLRDLGYGTGEEAIRVITKYKGFSPGEQRGRKVSCSYSLPISIQSEN